MKLLPYQQEAALFLYAYRPRRSERCFSPPGGKYILGHIALAIQSASECGTCVVSKSCDSAYNSTDTPSHPRRPQCTFPGLKTALPSCLRSRSFHSEIFFGDSVPVVAVLSHRIKSRSVFVFAMLLIKPGNFCLRA